MKTRTKALLAVFFLYSFAIMQAQSLANRIGVCTSPENAVLLKNSGCAYVEIGIRSFLMPDKPDSAFVANMQKAKHCALPIYSGNGFFPGELRLTGPDVKMDKLLEYGRNAMRRAHEIGLKVMVLGSGTARNIPDGFSREEAVRQFTEICSRLAKMAEEYNVVIAIEPLQHSETNFINTVSDGADIARAVNNPHLGVLADFFHMMRENEDPADLIKAGKLLKHCHIAEKEVRSAPGVKGDDFTPFFKALKAMHYKGNLSIECHWDDMKTQLTGSVTEIQRQLHVAYEAKK
ncbi:MAG: sugar phosphate isomerase/epimerase [Parabacteroides sp.]|nr:sugar phosphate isomerase/epimerase [Parabacteroides sp.]